MIPAHTVGDLLGLISTVIWVIALFPQIYLNYKNGSCEGLAFDLILFWTLGDLSNVEGSILAHQTITQIVVGYALFRMCYGVINSQ